MQGVRSISLFLCFLFLLLWYIKNLKTTYTNQDRFLFIVYHVFYLLTFWCLTIFFLFSNFRWGGRSEQQPHERRNEWRSSLECFLEITPLPNYNWKILSNVFFNKKIVRRVKWHKANFSEKKRNSTHPATFQKGLFLKLTKKISNLKY